MSKIPHIILDNREHKLQKVLDQRKDRITYEVEQLEVADIVITNDVAIERKEGSDYISSISDGRLFEQLIRLKDAYPIPILIIEGLNDKALNNSLPSTSEASSMDEISSYCSQFSTGICKNRYLQ